MTADRSLTAANIRKGSHSAFAVPVLQLACKDEAKTSRRLRLVFIFPAAMLWAAVYCFYFFILNFVCFLFFAQAHGGRKTNITNKLAQSNGCQMSHSKYNAKLIAETEQLISWAQEQNKTRS